MPVTSTSCLERARGAAAPMRLARASVYLLALPMVRTFRSAYGRSSGRKRVMVVRLEDADGVVGWGEAPVPDRPQYGADTVESTWYALTELIVPPLLAATFDGPADAAASWADLIGQQYAKNAAETACWAIASAKLGVPLAQLWGGVRELIPVGESFPICDSAEALLAEVSGRLAEGFGRVKLKIAPGWDVAAARAVREAFPAVPLSVDANCGYPPGGGPPWPELDELGLVMIEQPLPGDALLDLAQLQRSLRTPLCLDESASAVNVTRTALALDAGRVVNIKPPRLGGILASIAVHDLCIAGAGAAGAGAAESGAAESGAGAAGAGAAGRVPAWCGGMLETGIGRGFNLALAALPGFTLHSDMSPARLFYAEDLCDPTFDIRPDGTIAVPAQPGNGFPVVPERVARATIRRWESNTKG